MAHVTVTVWSVVCGARVLHVWLPALLCSVAFTEHVAVVCFVNELSSPLGTLSTTRYPTSSRINPRYIALAYELFIASQSRFYFGDPLNRGVLCTVGVFTVVPSAAERGQIR